MSDRSDRSERPDGRVREPTTDTTADPIEPRRGDRGPAVAEIRAALAELGLLPGGGTVPDPSPADVDEPLFDATIEQAVRQFQQRRGLTASGIVDAATYRALDEARWRLGDRLLTLIARRPMVGDDVAELQRRLRAYGFDPGRIDGIYGPHTEHAVRDFQEAVGIGVDGVCGFATFDALARFETARPRDTGPFAREAAAPVVASVREAERVRRSGPRLAGKVIVLDPGHGGSDRGACAHDLCEADVVLDLASRIEGRLAATGVRAYPTRGRFNGPSELDRARFANDIGADLLVSLHADRHPDPQASGVSTYYYGYYGPAAGRAGSGPTVVSAVGERLAGLIRRELVARTRLVDGRSHAKTWDLLRRTTMPAVRVEIGYLTNPGDAMLLSRPAFRDAVAESVVVAIQRLYLPPDDDYPTGVLRLSDLL